MTEENFGVINNILQEEFDFDGIDVVEFWMYYERKTGEHIPDEWLTLTTK